MNRQRFARGLRARLSYANVIATLALFIALGGVSYAAVKLPKNSVTSKAIKKNAVTSPKIKKSAVDSSKIKNGSITGLDIKNGSIGASKLNTAGVVVPSAIAAGTANDTFNTLKLATSSASNADEATARAQATEIPLVSNGPVSVYGKCFTVTGVPGATHFETYAKSTADGAALQGYSIYDSAYDPALGPGTLESDRVLSDDETDGADNVDDDYAHGASLLGPDGKGMMFDIMAYARFGTPASGPGFLPASETCAFHVAGSYTK